MKSIKTLIKLSKQQLDEKRRELVECEKNKEKLLEYSRLMKEELMVEAEFAAKSPELAITFDNYRKTILEKQGNIVLAVRDLDRQIAVIAEEIREVFGEIKRYEVFLQQKLLEEEKELKNKESKFLDAIATDNYLREMTEKD
jgi:hypothetical protein